MKHPETPTREMPEVDQKHSIGDKQVEYVKTERAGYYRIITNIEKMADESLRNYPNEEELKKATLFNNKESKTSQSK